MTEERTQEGLAGLNLPEVVLLDLFEGRLQLIVLHVMYDPGWDLPCRSCSAAVDEIARGHLNHLRARTRFSPRA